MYTSTQDHLLEHVALVIVSNAKAHVIYKHVCYQMGAAHAFVCNPLAPRHARFIGG